jgi:AraC family transcriptional regulator of arabinose operon
MIQKQEGFKGQLSIVLPEYIQTEMQSNPLTKLLFLTDIGYYPQALYHFRERPAGCSQQILIHCTSGTGWVQVDKIHKRITKDQFFIVPAHIPHCYGSSDSDPWSIYWMHFSGESSANFTHPALTVRTSESLENSRYTDRIRLFEEIYQTLSMGYSVENLEYANICVWHYLGSFFYLHQFQRTKDTCPQDIIERSIHYMQDHVTDNISLHDLASHCGYSVSHFSLLFRKKTTRSPVEYFLGLKIQRACQMLDSTEMRIKEIATRLAFIDPYYFSRLFHKITGMSPADYRKKKKG